MAVTVDAFRQTVNNGGALTMHGFTLTATP